MLYDDTDRIVSAEELSGLSEDCRTNRGQLSTFHKHGTHLNLIGQKIV